MVQQKKQIQLTSHPASSAASQPCNFNMASKSTSPSPENENFTNIENETEHTSYSKKRRRKGFLWNPNISISSRRVWRRKRTKTSAEASSLIKLAENDDGKFAHEGEPTAPAIEQDIYEEAGCEDTKTCGSDDNDSDTSSTDYEGYVSSDDSLPMSDEDQADLPQFEAESRYSISYPKNAFFCRNLQGKKNPGIRGLQLSLVLPAGRFAVSVRQRFANTLKILFDIDLKCILTNYQWKIMLPYVR